MAEAFLRHLADDRFEVISAGLEPRPIHPLAVNVMAEKGIDIGAQTSKSLSQFLGRVTVKHAIILCERAEQNCPRFWLGALERMFWRIDDPEDFQGTEDEKLIKFRVARDEIEQRLTDWLAGNPGVVEA